MTLLFVVSSLISLRLAALLLLAGGDVWRRYRRGPLPEAPAGGLPALVVLVPAYNEARVIAGTIATLLRSDHPELSVVVIDDGSSDETLAIARAAAAAPEDRRLRVVSVQPNGGKAAALNVGLQVAAGSAAHVATVDADTLVAPDTLRRLCTALAEEGADAAASNVKVGNRRNWLLRWQSLEYVVGLNLERRAQATLGCITTLPGAACAFRAEALRSVGGFSSDTVVEDTDLTLTLQRAGRRIIHVPEAVVYTEAPAGWGGLYRQRRRWLRGYLQCLGKHRAAFFRPTVLGWFGMPNLLFVHLLLYLLVPLSLPSVVRLFTWTGWPAFAATLLGLFGAELVVTALAYAVDREDPRDLLHVPLRRLVWPWFLFFVFVGVCAAALRDRGGGGGWGRAERQGQLAAAGTRGEPGVVS